MDSALDRNLCSSKLLVINNFAVKIQHSFATVTVLSYMSYRKSLYWTFPSYWAISKDVILLPCNLSEHNSQYCWTATEDMFFFCSFLDQKSESCQGFVITGPCVRGSSGISDGFGVIHLMRKKANSVRLVLHKEKLLGHKQNYVWCLGKYLRK